MKTNRTYGGQTMVGRLRRVMVCDPESAGLNAQTDNWQALAYQHRPDFALAKKQHQALLQELEKAHVEVTPFTASGGLSMDAVYAHDASFLTDEGAILMNMGKACRSKEPARHREFYKVMGVPILGEVRGPGTAEAGDMVWLDSKTILVGRGYRTNAEGIEQLRTMLKPHGVEVISAPLPHASGPSCCMHLMSLISMLDEHTMLVDLPWLAVETVQLLQARKFRLVEIDGAERDTLACNVLSLGDKRLLAIEENRRTNERLRHAGFDVRTFPGSEIGINGGGGPTCLTRPLLREAAAAAAAAKTQPS